MTRREQLVFIVIAAAVISGFMVGSATIFLLVASAVSPLVCS